MPPKMSLFIYDESSIKFVKPEVLCLHRQKQNL